MTLLTSTRAKGHVRGHGHARGHEHARGFTLIELLVVIAIIGILSSVVLASLNSARNKGNDAAIKGNLATVQVQSEIFYDSGSTYASMCSNTTITQAISAAGTASGATAQCYSDANEYVAAAKLKSDNTQWWCIDYKGVKILVPNATKNFDNAPADGNIDCD